MNTNTVLQVVAIDDEPLSLRRVELAIKDLPNVALTGMSRSGQDGVALVKELRPDVLLLDINMPEFDGFDVVAALGEDPPLVIFVTAFQDFAIKAFNAQAQDYLLKPVEFGDLHQALERARIRLAERERAGRAEELMTVVQALRAAPPTQSTRRFENEIWVPWGGSFERLSVADIDWINAEGDYVRIYARDKTYLLRETMARMESRLDGELFHRVHRSALVNQPKVERIERPKGKYYALVLANGMKVPVGRNYVKHVRAWLAVLTSERAA